MQGQLKVEDALSRIPGEKGERFVELFTHGTLAVELYAPRGSDSQKPHTRDEVYVVVSGSGKFLRAAEEVPFSAGDVLFVAAHEEHGFTQFTDDFATWVFFYGPEGGEAGKRSL